MSNVIEQFGALSPQQCFDISAQHILKTRRQCKDVTGCCTYSGLGCAASPFLTPKARKKLVGSWGVLVSEGEVPPMNRGLIGALQMAHDDYFTQEGGFMSFWKKQMRKVAKRYNLSTRLIDEDDAKCKSTS